jgi:hypothetical protein
MFDEAIRFLHRVFPTRERYILTTVLSQRTTSNGEGIPFRDARGMCKPALLLLSEGHLIEAEFTAVHALAQGKGPGVWRWLFDYRPRLNLRKLNTGNKGLIELFEEIKKGEAKLRLRPWDKRVRRLAERIRVFICDSTGRWWVVEVARKYYGAPPKFRKKPHAVTGSIQNFELSRIVLAAQREVAQEIGIEFPLEAFKLQPLSAISHANDEHESDAYKGLLSINKDYDVTLVVDPWPEEWFTKPPVIIDTCITVYTKVEERIIPEPANTEPFQLRPEERVALSSLMKTDTQ